MRRILLAFLPLLLPSTVLATTWYPKAPSTLDTTPPGEVTICTSSGNTACTFKSPTTTTDVLVEAVLAKFVTAITTTDAQTITFTFGYVVGEVESTICDVAWEAGSGLTAETHIFSCLPFGNTVPSGASYFAKLHFAGGGNAANTMFTTSHLGFKAACIGGHCACTGICSNATAPGCGALYTYGTDYSDIDDLSPCGCQCSACGSASPETSPLPALSSLVCTDLNDGVHLRCDWSAFPSAATYKLKRSSTEIYSGPLRTYLDSPGSGQFSYSAYAEAASWIPAVCSPTSGKGWAYAGTVYSKPVVGTGSTSGGGTAPPPTVRPKGVTVGVW